MRMITSRTALKSILGRVASTDTGKWLLSRNTEGLATVFLLHRAAGVYPGINGHDPGGLERIIVELKRRKFNLVSLQQVVDAAVGQANLPSGSIAFTVDDGYLDQIEVIAPIFVKHKVPLTIFLNAGLINGEIWPWDAKIHWLIQHASLPNIEIKIGYHYLKWSLGSQLERLKTRRELQAICTALPREKFDDFIFSVETAAGVELPQTPPAEFSPASWDQIRQFENAGVRFAPHTFNHRILSNLTESEVRFEMRRSLEIVMAETSNGLSVIAYPVGREMQFGLREIQLAESMGFSAAFAVCEDYARWGESRVQSQLRYRLGRFELPHSISETIWVATGLQKMSESCAHISRIQEVGEGGTNYSISQNMRSLNRRFKASLIRLVDRLHSILGRYDSLMLIDTERIERLVFVCRGNVCRSPYAEAAAKSLGLLAISCGTDVSCSAPAEAVAVRAAFLRGKDISEHMSCSVIDVPLCRSDCLVAMDPSHLSASREAVARAGCQVTLIGLWKKPLMLGIPDPFGRPLEDFSKCFGAIDEALAGLVYWIEPARGEGAKAIENDGKGPTK